MKILMRVILAACLTTLWAAQAMAAPRTFMVMPFQIQGPQGYGYLEKAIPSTLAARFFRQDQLQPAAGKAPAKAPGSAAEAGKAQAAAGADYAVWGTLAIVGDEANLEVRVRDKAGKEWSRSVKTPVGGLIGAVQNAADGVSREVFGMPVNEARSNVSNSPVNQMNPDIVVNETGRGQVYLNPQFRYQGAGAADGSRLRSRTLPYVMVDFAVGKFSGKGKYEIAVLGEHKLFIYEWNEGKLKQLLEHVISMSNQAFSLRSIDLDKNGVAELVVATFDPSNNRPASYVYTFAGGTLREFAPRSEYFLSVAKLPPNFTPVLTGQGWDSVKLFRPGVHMMQRAGEKFTLGPKLDLPEGTNVFNFGWLPGSSTGDGDKLMVLTPGEQIKVFSAKGALMHQTMERFSGSSAGMEHYKSVEGLGVDTRYQLPDKYYAPMRLLAADLERKGEYVLLVNKPVSTASQFFDRYRYFPQGEIHALYWDGVGMGLKWKTRRIRGSVVDVDIADINNDGVQDLVVGLNTHPGMVGVGSRQCLITAYPLDLNLADPGTAPDTSEFEAHN